MIFLIYTLLQISYTQCFKWFSAEGYDPSTAFGSLPKYEARIEDAPHHVLVFYARWYCSGSLVSSRTVVTCASCFFKRTGENAYVKVGSKQYLDGKAQRLRALEVKLHEFYRRLTPVDNDIALLFLEKNVKLSAHVKKIPLVEPEISLRLQHAVRVSGYGADNVPSRLRNQLLLTSVLVVNNDVCTAAFGRIMSFSNFCGKLYLPENHLSDNGGGATLMNLLVGILVAGATTDKPNAAVLTNVSYFHRWIVLNTQRFHEKYCNTTVGSDDSSSYEDYGIAFLTQQKSKLSKKKNRKKT